LFILLVIYTESYYDARIHEYKKNSYPLQAQVNTTFTETDWHTNYQLAACLLSKLKTN